MQLDDVMEEGSLKSAGSLSPGSRNSRSALSSTPKAKKKKKRSRDRSYSDPDASGESEDQLSRSGSSASLGSIAISPDVAGRRRSQVNPALGDFIKAGTKPIVSSLSEHQSRGWIMARICAVAHSLINDNYLANVTAIVVLFDAWLTCYDIDARAASITDPLITTPTVVSVASDLCLVVYTLELILFFSVRGICVMKTLWRDFLFMVDLGVLVCGYAELILSALGMFDAMTRVGMLRLLRVARILRLTRILRKSASLKELRRLLTMMATCMKALAWSFLICFGVMSFWAMLMVEMVYPIIWELGPEKFPDCGELCVDITGSVMNANLLLFKTVIAGDSWGEIAVPVIQAYPATAIIFVGSQLTLVFGVLNLIVAVVVDTFAEARAHDVLNLAEEMEQEMVTDKKSLQKIFDRIDHDHSGTVTIDELVEGARRDPEFQSRLQVMDIDEVDLQQLFEMIDTEGCGYVEARQFIGPLSRWVRDSKTAPRFVKYNLMRMLNKHDEFVKSVDIRFELLGRRLDEMMEEILYCGRMDSHAESSEDMTPVQRVAAKRHSHSKMTPTGSHSLQNQFRQFRATKAQGAAEEDEAVEQPQASSRPTFTTLRGPGDEIMHLEHELAESFRSAMEALQKSVMESMSTLKRNTIVTESTVHELFTLMSSRIPARGQLDKAS